MAVTQVARLRCWAVDMVAKAERYFALARGDKFYNTGIPCKHGHVAPRRTADFVCSECEKVRWGNRPRKGYAGRFNNLTKIIERHVLKLPTGCWQWTSVIERNGYGRVTVNYKAHLVHRYVYEQLVGKIPHGMQIDHICKHRSCVNPAHMEAVPPAENNARSSSPSALNARKTACVRGHRFTPENIYIPPKTPNKRHCRACLKLRGSARGGAPSQM